MTRFDNTEISKRDKYYKNNKKEAIEDDSKIVEFCFVGTKVNIAYNDDNLAQK